MNTDRELGHGDFSVVDNPVFGQPVTRSSELRCYSFVGEPEGCPNGEKNLRFRMR